MRTAINLNEVAKPGTAFTQRLDPPGPAVFRPPQRVFDWQASNGLAQDCYPFTLAQLLNPQALGQSPCICRPKALQSSSASWPSCAVARPVRAGATPPPASPSWRHACTSRFTCRTPIPSRSATAFCDTSRCTICRIKNARSRSAWLIANIPKPNRKPLPAQN
jgi:hypothetical protein